MEREQAMLKRVENFRGKMEAAGINLAIICRSVNVFHFTDFNPINFSMPSYVVIPAKGDACLLLNAIRGPRSNELSAMRNIKLFGKWSDNPSIAANEFDALKVIADSYQLGELHVGCDLGGLSYAKYKKITAALGIDEITDISEVIEREKLVKDELALERVKVSAKITNIGMNKMLECLRAGATEIDAVIETKYTMLKEYSAKYSDYIISGFGSPDASIQEFFNVYCASGIRTSYGAEHPRKVVPQKGDLVLPVVTTKISGYSVENERTLYVGELDDYRMSIFKTVVEARGEVFKVIKPGIPFSVLYNAAADVFRKNGFGDFVPGRIGHGIGLTIHEFLSVNAACDILLEPGMVFTVEPGLMSAKFGGVRPSDTVLVTENGYENLTDTENGILKI